MDKEEVRKLIGELRSVIYDTNCKEDVDEANLTINVYFGTLYLYPDVGGDIGDRVWCVPSFQGLC